jgi:hypothetical protein
MARYKIQSSHPRSQNNTVIDMFFILSYDTSCSLAKGIKKGKTRTLKTEYRDISDIQKKYKEKWEKLKLSEYI